VQGDVQDDQRDLLVFNAADDRREALELSRALRQRGYAVARDIIRRDLESSLKYAVRSGIRAVLVIGAAAENQTYQLIQTADRTEQSITRDQLWQQFPARN
jgi:ATP phosphoribosyltransferase regulatory subunit